jgi:hypothetical protein
MAGTRQSRNLSTNAYITQCYIPTATALVSPGGRYL